MEVGLFIVVVLPFPEEEQHAAAHDDHEDQDVGEGVEEDTVVDFAFLFVLHNDCGTADFIPSFIAILVYRFQNKLFTFLYEFVSEYSFCCSLCLTETRCCCIIPSIIKLFCYSDDCICRNATDFNRFAITKREIRYIGNSYTILFTVTVPASLLIANVNCLVLSPNQPVTSFFTVKSVFTGSYHA